MTPIDDHLRTTLSTRAAGLAPSPDPFSGIETRARGLRRRRAGVAVAGAALAAAAVGLAVPAVVGGHRAAPAQVATSTSALDAEHPWAYRGTPLPADVLAGFRAGWSAVHPGSTLTPLFGDKYEISGRWEAVFIAHGPDGDRYGFIDGPPNATNLILDEPLPTAPKALALAVPGDEVSRVLVVAAPDSRAVELSNDGVTYRRIEAQAQCAKNDRVGPCPSPTPVAGTGLAALEGTAPRVRVTGNDGTVVYDDPAPVAARTTSPDNLLTWQARGTQDSSLLEPARAALAPSLKADPSQVLLQVLYTGDRDGVRFVMGQAWKRGDAKAHSFAYAQGGTNGPSPFFGPLTPTDPQVLAFLIDSLPGASTDLLVVVPRPGTGQVSYSPDATTGVQPVANGRSDLNGVALIDRSRTPGADRLDVLDGDGNIDQPLYRGPVAPLLCGDTSCG